MSIFGPDYHVPPVILLERRERATKRKTEDTPISPLSQASVPPTEQRTSDALRSPSPIGHEKKKKKSENAKDRQGGSFGSETLPSGVRKYEKKNSLF